MEETGLPDFSGKVVFFYLKNAPTICDDGILMEYLSFEKKDGRIFIMGRIPELQGMEWLANCQAAVEWESVIHYIEFKSIEDYTQRSSKFKPTLLQKLKNK